MIEKGNVPSSDASDSDFLEYCASYNPYDEGLELSEVRKIAETASADDLKALRIKAFFLFRKSVMGTNPFDPDSSQQLKEIRETVEQIRSL